MFERGASWQPCTDESEGAGKSRQARHSAQFLCPPVGARPVGDARILLGIGVKRVVPRRVHLTWMVRRHPQVLGGKGAARGVRGAGLHRAGREPGGSRWETALGRRTVHAVAAPSCVKPGAWFTTGRRCAGRGPNPQATGQKPSPGLTCASMGGVGVPGISLYATGLPLAGLSTAGFWTCRLGRGQQCRCTVDRCGWRSDWLVLHSPSV